MPYWFSPGCDLLQFKTRRRHQFRVSGSCSSSALIPLGKAAKLYSQNCGLHCIKPRIKALLCVHIFFFLSPIAEMPNFLGQCIVVRNYGATIAVCAEILPRVEAEAAEVTDCAAKATFVFSPVCLCGVFDYAKVVSTRDCQNRIHVRRVTVEMNRDNCLRSRRDCRFESGNVDVVECWLAIDENGAGAGIRHGKGRRDKCVRRQDNLITRSDTDRS